MKVTPKKSYEVTILGVGKRPLVNCFEAHSPGYAGRLAKDKYGDWIKISEVREIPKSKVEKRTTRRSRGKLQRPLITEESTAALPVGSLLTMKSKFIQQAAQEKLLRAERRAAQIESFERRCDESTFK